jgi:hypothetical protein
VSPSSQASSASTLPLPHSPGIPSRTLDAEDTGLEAVAALAVLHHGFGLRAVERIRVGQVAGVEAELCGQAADTELATECVARLPLAAGETHLDVEITGCGPVDAGQDELEGVDQVRARGPVTDLVPGGDEAPARLVDGPRDAVVRPDPGGVHVTLPDGDARGEGRWERRRLENRHRRAEAHVAVRC